jgi:DNA-binding NtrC family response regulator
MTTQDITDFKLFQTCFRKEYQVEKAMSKEAALEMLRKKRYEFIFIDLGLLQESITDAGYKAAFQPFWHLYPSINLIVMCTQKAIREAVMAVKAGAGNFITYPINPDELRYVTESVSESQMLQFELDYLRDQFWDPDALDLVNTRSDVMKKVFEKIRSVAPTKSTVLLSGDTGSGKSVLAKLIHQHSNRRDAQFISVHCGAIPDALVESELFGHEKGAFTGAIRRKLGKFEIAMGGTIFLDEIGTITLSTQIKLLQVLQDGTMSRVGGEETIDTNVRVISATNTDLKSMSEAGLFRKDLYYRLNVFPIEVPALRERIEDIPLFVEVFLKKLDKFYPKEIYDVHSEVMEAFIQYDWPGNIREMENLMERAYILEKSSVLTPESFPAELFESSTRAMVVPGGRFVPLAEARRKGVEEIERRYLKELLSRNKGKINLSAKDSGITTRQLHKLMKKYDLRKEEFK